MKIGIISDTHGDYASWKYIIDVIFNDVDTIIHAGDILYGTDHVEQKKFINSISTLNVDILYARGNCDKLSLTSDLPIRQKHPYGVHSWNGKKIVYTHGDMYPSLLAKKMIALEEQASIVIYGHTHVYSVDIDHGIYYINPGSPAQPKNKNKIPTVMLLDNTNLFVVNCQNNSIIESYVVN